MRMLGIWSMTGEYGEQVGFAYDISSIVVGFTSGTGEAMQSVRLLKTIKGNEIEAIIRAYATGAEYVNIGTSTYYLKIKDE